MERLSYIHGVFVIIVAIGPGRVVSADCDGWTAFIGYLELSLSRGRVTSTDCNDGWTAYHGSCYLFAHNTTLDFHSAENYCRLHNAHVVNIGDAAENNFIKSYLAALKTERFWIGVTDDVIENEWKWVSTDLIQGFSDWITGEPNNDRGVEDCATFEPPSYQWNDVPCTQKYDPICEIRVWDGPGPEVG